MKIADLFDSHLNETVDKKLAERMRELISEQDPTIDWSKVRIKYSI